ASVQRVESKARDRFLLHGRTLVAARRSAEGALPRVIANPLQEPFETTARWAPTDKQLDGLIAPRTCRTQLVESHRTWISDRPERLKDRALTAAVWSDDEGEP